MGDEYVNGWCCADCLTLLANGETNPEWSALVPAGELDRELSSILKGT